MKRIYLALPVIFFILPLAARAEEINLGNFSVDDTRDIAGATRYFHFADQKFIAGKDDFSAWIKIRPIAKVQNDYRFEAENIFRNQTDDPKPAAHFQFLIQSKNCCHSEISNAVSIDENALTNFLRKKSEEKKTDPANARFSFSGGKVAISSPSKNGFRIDAQKSVVKIVEQMENNPFIKDFKLEFETLEPEISDSDPEKYGIKELLGEGTSNFRGSPKNRIHNVNVGASRFNGVLIKPGEEFSFIKTLGPVDETTGYLPELVIKADKTVPEYGGGVCQVSTTMFRAALKAGLKITARVNHAYPVQYYSPVGLDATVYIPNPDLKFLNDTPNYVLVQTRVEGTQLFFDFFGTPDGRQAKIVGPQVLEKNGDGSMKTVAWQEVYGADGNLARKDTFKSNYDSPDKYPHPGQEKITRKPADWSGKQWKEYKKANGM